ncbi:hypothetical protein [Nocardioides terrae]|uniref:hypothetical protein n=1 Tax=Nocardioides terrae TaxID=574651 RepID=UPI000B88A9DC|nr:hypothetical protein [Nocardioides terrae]
MAAVAPTASIDIAHADTTVAAVVFYTPVDAQTARTGSGVHLLLGTSGKSVQLSYSTDDGANWSPIGGPLTPSAGMVDTTWVTAISGKVDLQATASLTDGSTSSDVVEDLMLSPTGGTQFTEPNKTDPSTHETLCGPFVRPRIKVVKGTCSAVPLGFYTSRLTGLTQARVSGRTTGTAVHSAIAPALGTSAPVAAAAAPSGGYFRLPVTLSPAQVAARRAVVRVTDGVSSEAVETPLYAQIVTHVRSTAIPYAGGYVIRTQLADQYGQPVVGAPARLTGYANGSSTPVNQLVATDVNGEATFPSVVPPNGFYIAVADLDLNGSKAASEPSFETVVGHLAHAAPGRALYHNNARAKGAGGTVGDSRRGTANAAARRYQWIDQDGHLSYSTLAARRGGTRQASQPGHLTWVNAHGAPYNPRWLGRGRFETRVWSGIRKRRGLRNADMTFQQNAARGLSVEWEVKDIRPFAKTAVLNTAFASLAASARRAYGSNWQNRVQIKVLSNLSGGQRFGLRVLKAAHAHGFSTMYLARGAATRHQIPASAHGYVDFVRGAAGTLYAYDPPAWQKDKPVPKDPALTAR